MQKSLRNRLRTLRREGSLAALLVIAAAVGGAGCGSEAPVAPKQPPGQAPGSGSAQPEGLQLMLSPSNP